MNYTQTLEFLFQSLPVFETQGATAYKPGLERITVGTPAENARMIETVKNFRL